MTLNFSAVGLTPRSACLASTEVVPSAFEAISTFLRCVDTRAILDQHLRLRCLPIGNCKENADGSDICFRLRERVYRQGPRVDASAADRDHRVRVRDGAAAEQRQTAEKLDRAYLEK